MDNSPQQKAAYDEAMAIYYQEVEAIEAGEALASRVIQTAIAEVGDTPPPSPVRPSAEEVPPAVPFPAESAPAFAKLLLFCPPLPPSCCCHKLFRSSGKARGRGGASLDTTEFEADAALAMVAAYDVGAGGGTAPPPSRGA